MCTYNKIKKEKVNVVLQNDLNNSGLENEVSTLRISEKKKYKKLWKKIFAMIKKQHIKICPSNSLLKYILLYDF